MFKYNDPDNSLAVTFDINSSMALQKKSLCTSPDRVFGYMFYLIRSYFGITQTEMGYSFNSLYKQKYINGLSKSAYAKVENGTTSINFDLILIYSGRYGIDFSKITGFYNSLVHSLYNNDCIFLEPCGYLGYGNKSGFANYEGASNDSLYTDLKDYKNFITQNELNLINVYIEQIFGTAKEAILFELAYIKEQAQL